MQHPLPSLLLGLRYTRSTVLALRHPQLGIVGLHPAAHDGLGLFAQLEVVGHLELALGRRPGVAAGTGRHGDLRPDL